MPRSRDLLVESKKWLYQKSVEEGLSVPKIAKLAGCGTWKVFNRLKKFGIPRNPVGYNLSRQGSDNYMNTPGAVNPFNGKCHNNKTRNNLSFSASVPKPYLRGMNNEMAGATGEMNPNWKGGVAPERQVFYESQEWKEVSRLVRKRDNHSCRRCGAKKKGKKSLHIHHIKGWTEYPELRCKAYNLVLLCKTCHDWVHIKANVNKEWKG